MKKKPPQQLYTTVTTLCDIAKKVRTTRKVCREATTIFSIKKNTT